ncbi:MAG: hypothetical protein H0V69_10510 [Acidimicrobiia bacterium]|nr:hypothetical protein [Acidimicrobiia bacterium]
MARKVWTAAELEKMSPAEQDDVFNSNVADDLNGVPPEFLARVKARLAERVAGIDSPNKR